MSPVLEIESLSHQYTPGLPVLEDISFSIEAGELVSVLGVSGSGKSTLLRSIAGFVTPTAGRIVLHGQTVVQDGVEAIPAEKRTITMVFQDYALFPHMNVFENVSFGIRGKEKAREVVRDLLALVGLEGFEERMPATLSGGQQQRVALARALAPDPALVVLDEPFANLDAPLRAGISSELKRILKERNVSALMVTHERTEALGVSDKVIVLASPASGTGGATVSQFGTPEEIYHAPTHLEGASLSGPFSLLPMRGEGLRGETTLGEVELRRPANGSTHVLGRPESFRLLEGTTCFVREHRFLGHGFHVEVETPDGGITVYCQHEPPAVGSSVSVQWSGPGCPIGIRD